MLGLAVCNDGFELAGGGGEVGRCGRVCSGIGVVVGKLGLLGLEVFEARATLQTFFRTHTGLGEKAQGLLARTFKVLVEFGDFSKSSPAVAKPPKPSKSAVDLGEGGGDRHGGEGNDNGGGVSPTQQPLALTVNLQIELPPSADGEVYDKLFAAMGKHLKSLITPPR